jgi:hypothetical protein
VNAVDWLLAVQEPAVRDLARCDLLGEKPRERVLDGPIVQTLLTEQNGHPYAKWRGAHWRLVSLVELGIPAGEPRALKAYESVLAWLTGEGHLRGIKTIDGLTRRCASQEGNALAVGVRLGLADDPRVERLARSLVEWQWPDGGWNCDKKATGYRSSFNESLPPMWGLHEYASATGAEWARAAADRTAELFLSHQLFRSVRTGEVVHEKWLVPHYPPFWHYDAWQALLVLGRMDRLRDPRATEALDLVEERRDADGLWRAAKTWWRPPGSKGSNVEVVDWGSRVPSAMVTLNALRILRAAGRAT